MEKPRITTFGDRLTVWRWRMAETFSLRQLKWAAGAVLLVAVLYYPVGLLFTHSINDETEFQPPERYLLHDGSRAISMAVALIDREVNDTVWAPNKPFFHPVAIIDNMREFQMGLIYSLGRFAIEMTDALGRTRSSSQVDSDLDTASGLLKYDPTVWIWNPSTSLMPTASSERQYLAAMRHLISYNERLSNGQAVYDQRADNLIALLERIGSDLGSQSAALDQRTFESDLGWFDFKADNIFYATKGRLYGYYMILRELETDFAGVIAEKKAEAVYSQMLDSLKTGAEMNPLIVSNGSNDGILFPSHLAVQGFYLLRARTRLKEVENILLK